MYDLIIIGSGPAGISAAIHAAKQKMNFIVLTGNIGSYMNFLDEAKAYPKLSYVSGYDLMRGLIEQMNKLGIVPGEGEEVRSLEETDKGFLVKTDRGIYESRALIAATGRNFRKLGITGEKDFEGDGLSYCAICDGEKFPDRTVAIIGGGHSGVFAASYMIKYAKKIYLIEEKMDIERTMRVKEAIRLLDESKKVEIITNAKPIEILGKGMVSGLKINENGKERLLKVEGVFVETGYTPNTGFIANMVKLNGDGEIIIDKNNATSRKGIFAAGDVTDVPAKQILVALGEGAKASFSAIKYLEENRLVR